MSTWIQLYVKAPAGNGYTTPQMMKRVDDHLTQSTPAAMYCPLPSGLPAQEEDGTWEVRVYDTESLGYVKSILTRHYGLEVVREVTKE